MVCHCVLYVVSVWLANGRFPLVDNRKFIYKAPLLKTLEGGGIILSPRVIVHYLHLYTGSASTSATIADV